EGGRCDAVQAARERALPAGVSLPRVLLRRDGGHEHRRRGEQHRRRVGLDHEAHADEPHAGLDNVAFLSSHQVTFVQDAGDNIHQDFGFDSGYVWDTNVDYSNPSNQPSRWLAEGRDPSATIDADTANTGNETDNEITGTTVERRPDDGRDPRCADPESRRLRLALVLDAAARRQHHVGGARLQPPRPRLGRRQRGRLIAERSYAPSVTTAYIGLGSNLGDREATILAAAERLGPHRLSPIV